MKVKGLILVLIAVVFVATINVAPTSAGVRDGCETMNIRQYDYMYKAAINKTAFYRAGDTIRISATWGPDGRPPVLWIGMGLRLDGEAVSVSIVPGTVQYVFPEDTMAELTWYNTEWIVLDWDVTCYPG